MGISNPVNVLAEQQGDQINPESRQGEVQLLSLPETGVVQELHHQIRVPRSGGQWLLRSLKRKVR